MGRMLKPKLVLPDTNVLVAATKRIPCKLGAMGRCLTSSGSPRRVHVSSMLFKNILQHPKCSRTVSVFVTTKTAVMHFTA